MVTNKKLIDMLNKSFGYEILEFNDTHYLEYKWGAVKRNENNLSEILCFISEEELNNIKNIEASLKKNHSLNSFKINFIIIKNDKEEFFLPTVSEEESTVILIDLNNRGIKYNKSESSMVLRDIKVCLEEMINTVELHKYMPVTKIIIGINVLMYILTAYLSSNILSSNTKVLIYLGAKVNSLIQNGEFYRLVTCMFLHGGIMHLVLNMYALYSLGSIIEVVLGKVKFIFIYFLSGLSGSLFSYFFSNSISIGASGAIFGLFGSALVYGYKMRSRIGRDFFFNIGSVIVVNLIIGFSIANVDNFGHIGGLLGGIILTLILPHNE